MQITVLAVPECPNAPLALERITAALDGCLAQVEVVDIADLEEAAWWGMTGSPTILLDGVDLFALPGAVPSVSCRLYRDADGTAAGAPSVAALREALAGTGRPEGGVSTECCEADALDVVGRAGRGWRAPA